MTKIQSGIKITAPATVSGLGCGLDIMAFALDKPACEIVIHRSNKSGIFIKNISGDKGQLSYEIEKNPAGLAAKLIWEALIRVHQIDQEIGIEIDLRQKLATGKGLGIKEAMVVAGAMAMNEFFGSLFSKQELLPLIHDVCTTLFSDFSSIALSTSLLGGCILLCDKETLDVRRLPVPQGLFLVIAYPTMDIAAIPFNETMLITTNAKLAIEQSRMLSGFLWAMYRSDFGLMGKSMQSPIFDDFYENKFTYLKAIKAGTKEMGAIAANLCNNGSGVFALCPNTIIAEKCSIFIDSVFKEHKLRYEVFTATINNEGSFLE